MIDEIKILLPAMQEAGDAVLKLQKHEFDIATKANNDIVTKADLLVNEILHTQLLKAFPDHGWLSEESVQDPKRLSFERLFIVDPIDGTREFATGIPEYAISVAVVENGIPIAAAVYNPVTKELFHAIKDEGAWLNQQKIHCSSTRPSSPRLSLLASRSEYKRGEWTQFEAQHEVKQVGSIAYKLALIAAGKADATFSLGPKSEWDIAAGVLLVKEAGGIAVDKLGKDFQFNQSNILVNGIVATTTPLRESIFRLISF